MRAVTWHGVNDVRVDEVPDPVIQEPTDAIIKVTSTAICGSDLHLIGPLSPLMHRGDVMGHEAMGIVEAVGSAVEHIQPGDRVVVPFNISCGRCWMCTHGLHSQCETTQVREQETGAALFGYTEMYGQVPGGQAEYLRVPQAHFGPIPVPRDDEPDERYLFLSDVLPTAWQAVAYADVPPGGSVVVVGLGPIGQMSARIARHQGASVVIGVDRVPERLAMAARHGADVVNLDEVDDVAEHIRARTAGRGPDSVVDAVGMEAHGSPVVEAVHKTTALMPSALSRPLLKRMGVDRLAALHLSIDIVRRGGTLSLSGVYGGMADPIPMLVLFDKQITLRMGQANVRRWIPDLLPLVSDTADPLGVLDLRTHRFPLAEAPRAYEMFQKKEDGCIKVVLDAHVGAQRTQGVLQPGGDVSSHGDGTSGVVDA